MRHETKTFGGKKVKSQGYTRPNIDLEAWRCYHSRPPWVKYRFPSWYRYQRLHRMFFSSTPTSATRNYDLDFVEVVIDETKSNW